MYHTVIADVLVCVSLCVFMLCKLILSLLYKHMYKMQYASAWTVCKVMDNFLQAELISASVRNRRQEGLEANQNEKKDISLSLSVSISYTCYGEEKSLQGEGGGGASSCERAVTLILITKATGMQSHNPLLCCEVHEFVLVCYKYDSHAKISSHMETHCPSHHIWFIFISKTHSLLKLNPNISKLPWTKCHDKIVLP